MRQWGRPAARRRLVPYSEVSQGGSDAGAAALGGGRWRCPGGGNRAPMRKPVPLGRVGDEGAVVVLTLMVARRPPEFRVVPRDPPPDPCGVGMAVEGALAGRNP